jgi:hypothetical protein
MLREEGGELAPGAFGRRSVVGVTLVAEKPMVRIGIDLQRVLLAELLEPRLDLSHAFERNERIGITEEQVDGRCDVGYCVDPLIQDHTVKRGRR